MLVNTNVGWMKFSRLHGSKLDWGIHSGIPNLFNLFQILYLHVYNLYPGKNYYDSTVGLS